MRKASIPSDFKRSAKSVGPSILQNEISIIDETTTATNANTTQLSIEKTKDKPYPDYFYTPKENLFEARRGSRYDKRYPPFHLTQVDPSMSKLIFSSIENKRLRPTDT